MLQGAMTAMVTPFRDGQVDYDRLAKNIEFQIESGIDGLVPVGTTGESPTLSHEEHAKVIEFVVEKAAGRTKVIAGTGSNATAEALKLTQHAKEVGADASLQVCPYYNKPSQEGLIRHFQRIADAVEIPLVLYNIPGRTGVQMSAETIAELAEHPNIVAVKEATGDVDLASKIASLCDITILSGSDTLTLPLIAAGGSGVISVVTNIIPKQFGDMVRLGLKGDLTTARETHLELFDLVDGTMAAGNPVSIKTMMKLLHMDSGELRQPLWHASEAQVELFQALLQKHGLI